MRVLLLERVPVGSPARLELGTLCSYYMLLRMMSSALLSGCSLVALIKGLDSAKCFDA